MKISKIEISELHIALKKPFITALRSVDAVHDIIIKIHTDSGLAGYGEACAVSAITGTTNARLLQDLKELLFPRLINQEVDEQRIFELLQEASCVPEARACIDIALFDLLSKEKGQSLAKYLGASSFELQTDLTISVNEPCIMKEETLLALQQGFSCLKIKLDGDVQKNIQRLHQINTVLPSSIKLRLDPNQSLDLQGCLSMLNAVDTANIECIEQPFAAADLASMKKLKASTHIPVLADESLFDLHDAKKLLHDEIADMLNIKLMKCGGIHEALRIAEFARSHRVKCMMGSMLEGPISLLAAAHCALAQDNISMADLDSPLYLQAHPLLEAFHFHKDIIRIAEEPGLGIDTIMRALELFDSEET